MPDVLAEKVNDGGAGEEDAHEAWGCERILATVMPPAADVLVRSRKVRREDLSSQQLNAVIVVADHNNKDVQSDAIVQVELNHVQFQICFIEMLTNNYNTALNVTKNVRTRDKERMTGV